jgi:hypothetical protein
MIRMGAAQRLIVFPVVAGCRTPRSSHTFAPPSIRMDLEHLFSRGLALLLKRISARYKRFYTPFILIVKQQFNQVARRL